MEASFLGTFRTYRMEED